MTDTKETPKETLVPETQHENDRAISTLHVDPVIFDPKEIEVLVDKMQGSGDSFFFGRDVRSHEGAQAAVLDLLAWADRVGVTVAPTKTANKS